MTSSSYRCSAVASLLLLVATVLVAGQQPSVEIQMTETYVEPGSKVTITCRVQNQEANIVMISKDFKTGGPDNAGYTDTLIAKGLLLNAPKSTGRYTLNVSPVTETLKWYTISITNASAEDSGPYRCGLSDVDVDDVKEFFVYHPVQELKFNNETAGTTLMLNESSTLDMDCSAIGSIPAANIEILLGSKNITHKFEKTTSSVLHCTSGSWDKKKCLTYETFDKNAYTTDYKPSYEDHNKELKCRATIGNGKNFVAKEVVHKIDMQFSPKFGANCKRHVMGRLHAESFKITCDILSNPGYPDFSWEFMWEGKKENLSNNQLTSDGEISVHQNDNGNGSIEVVLMFKKLNKRHFMTYQLHSKNSLGSNMTKIKLEEDPRYRISLPPDETNNGAGKMSATAILVSLFALMKLSL